MRWLVIPLSLITTAAFATSYVNDDRGINSFVTGLDGAAIQIGQVESFLPGMANYDTNDHVFASNTSLAFRWLNGGITAVNDINIDKHPSEVSQLMIGAGPQFDLYRGVAPDASLYFNGIQQDTEDKIATSLDFLAQKTSAPSSPTGGNVPVDIKAINFSAHHALQPFIEDTDGNSLLTRYVDWSASRYDVLYVVSWGNAEDDEERTPSDNFNGLTVAGLETDSPTSGLYNRFWVNNATTGDAAGDRTSIDLLAPATLIRMKAPEGTPGGEWLDQGTSLATPLVTASVALLQQYAQLQINASKPRFSGNAKRHEVMKSIMLNSADKLKDVHGSFRDIKDSQDHTWINTGRHDIFVPLDSELGAGALNVDNAVKQLSPGEYGPGSVPLIGWDYGSIGFGGRQEYVFNQPLTGDRYIAITLCWDVKVDLVDLDNDYQEGDQFFQYSTHDDNMNNLDVFLMKADGTNLITDSVIYSESFEDNVEHIFFKDFPTGNYKIVVAHTGGLGTAQNYALSWWYGDPKPADFDKDGDVDGDDFQQWKGDFGQNDNSDADGDGDSDGNDFLAWQQMQGMGAPTLASSASVPEPAAFMLLGLAFVFQATKRKTT